MKNLAKYTVLIGLTVFLVWFSLSQLKVEEGQSKVDFILATWKRADPFYLFLFAVISLFSHLARAERWRLLMKPIGYNFSISHSFLSVMVGYFVNLAIPRGGELSRCVNLYRLKKIPVDVSLGTVIAERVIDLMFLIVCIILAFFVEFDKLYLFCTDLAIMISEADAEKTKNVQLIIAAVIGIVIIGLGSIWFALKSNNPLILTIRTKIISFIQGLKAGLMSVFQLERRGLFIFYSFAIWFLYYIMAYVLFLAFEETSHLGLLSAITIFVIAGIAMVIPLPGGTGSYHTLVPLGLTGFYGLSQSNAVAFTFILHGWQTLILIVVGAISLFLSQILFKHSDENAK